jgi:membrane protein
MAWTTSEKVMQLRRRSAFVDVVVEMLDGFRRHQTGRNAAVLTYYGFLTLFPLFLAATTVVGLVLESRPEWRDDLIGSAVESVPFIGQELATTGSIGGSWWALVFGLLVALWGSMKAFVGLQTAYDDTWEVPLDDRGNIVRQRLRALIGLAVIGGSQVATVVLGTLVAEAGLPSFGQAAIVAGGFAINLVVLGTMYRFLTSASTTWAMIWPGTVLVAAVYTAIQFAGTRAITAIQKSADTYGDFAGVLSVLAWLSVHALVNLLGAELNAAIHRRSDTVDEPAPVPEAVSV